MRVLDEEDGVANKLLLPQSNEFLLQPDRRLIVDVTKISVK
jgi:hypothetical protein